MCSCTSRVEGFENPTESSSERRSALTAPLLYQEFGGLGVRALRWAGKRLRVSQLRFGTRRRRGEANPPPPSRPFAFARSSSWQLPEGCAPVTAAVQGDGTKPQRQEEFAGTLVSRVEKGLGGRE